MFRIHAWVLAALAIGATGSGCGGQVAPWSHAPIDSGPEFFGDGGPTRVPDAAPATDGSSLDGGTPGNGGGTGAGGAPGGGSDAGGWDGSPGPNGCVPAWWGTSLDGVVGLRSCPGPYAPAILAYGQTIYNSCNKLTGPTATKQAGETTSCCYVQDETACGNPYTGGFCVELPYFGDGTKDATVPGAPVTAQLKSCSLPAGPTLTPSTQSARASALIGVWLRCGANSVLGIDGIVFHGNGTFRMLKLDATGRLVPASGCDRAGLWGFITNPNQLNLYTDSGTFIGSASFSSGPPLRFRYDGFPGNAAFIRVQ